MGCTKRCIVCTWHDPGTRVYAGVSAAAPIIPTKPHVITTLRTQDDMAETTVLSSTKKLPSLPVQQPPGANKPVDKTHYLIQPEIKDLCSAGPHPDTPMPNQKHPALPGKTPKATNIYRYTFPGYKMVSTSLNPTHDDNDSHFQLDIIDKNKDENRNKFKPKHTQHIPFNRIHPIDIEATTGSSIHCNMPIRIADIANYEQWTPHFTLSLPTKSPTTDHSALSTTPTTSHLPTVDDPRIPHTLSTQYSKIHPAHTKFDNDSATPQIDYHQHPTLLTSQSQLNTTTTQPHNPKTQHQLCSYSNHSVITTIVALIPACKIPHSSATHT